MANSVQYYLNHIAQYEREFSKWDRRSDKIVKRYKDESERRDGAKFNILWSNVQTLKASTFTNLPQPDVSRRFKDNDPVGRVASLILERALEFEVTHYPEFRQTMKSAIYDRFLGGRGMAWVRYEPLFTGGEQSDTGQITEDEEAETRTAEELDFECAPTDYVHWRDFGHSVARTWEEVGIVWRKVYLTRQAADDRFPDYAGKIPLDASPQDSKNSQATDPDSVTNRALIYEIWDKETGKALWLSKSLNCFVDEQDDPLQLEGFFPCPRPLYSTLTTDSLIPIPDFALYQDQAAELDTLSDRIDGLVKALKIFGVYDASIPELARLFKEGSNNSLLPVKNWAAFAEKQGLRGAIDIVEIAPIAQALNDAYAAFEQIKRQIYELTGIADIQRGNTMASETATAQQIKNQYASLRLKVYQDEVALFAQGLLRLKAEIICKHFDPMTLIKMSGAEQLSDVDKQLIPQAIMLLKDNVTRNFRIEVASDSMVLIDEQQDKQDRVEFLTATSTFIEKIVQAGQTAPQLVPLGVELLKFGVTGFKVGKNLEGVIDQFADKMTQQAGKPQGPSPEQQQAQAKQQHEAALEQFRAQQEGAQRQYDAALEMQRLQHESAMKVQDQQHAMRLEMVRQQAETDRTNFNNQIQMILKRMDNMTKLEVAEIGAQTTLDAAQISAAHQGADE